MAQSERLPEEVWLPIEKPPFIGYNR